MLDEAAQYKFYWRDVNRVEIETILKTRSDGSYCVRLARDQSLCLSVKHHKIFHLKLVEDDDGFVKIGHGNRYASIKYFMEELNTNRHSLKILDSTGKSEMVALLFPVEPEIPEAGPEDPYITMPSADGRRLSALKEQKFIKTAHLEKLADFQGFLKSEPKWNERYFVLEDDTLKWYHDDEKTGKVKAVNVENINDVHVIEDFKKRKYACLISSVDKELYISGPQQLLKEWQDILTKNAAQINKKKGLVL